MLCQLSRAGNPARKCIPAAALVLLFGVGLALLPVPGAATTAVGRTVGSFAVSPTGAATYTIPIWAPAGPNGMQPDIALVYSSQVLGGPGAPVVGKAQPCSKPDHGTSCPLVLLMPQQSATAGSYGVGWNLQGLSSIYRCNLTFAQDAAPASVALATSDGYCMDGQRLRLTSGTYGVAGSTYQTEIANFVNVTAYGSAGNGPAYWVAQDRNGRSYTYGNGGSSQVLATGSSTAVAWMLDEVSDPPGNTMTVSYNTASGMTVPATVSWTPISHGSSTYEYTMTFAYGTNAAPPRGYVAGTSFTNPNLLSSIAIAYSGTAVKTYYLTYQISGTTGRDLLTQVQECAGSGTSNCLMPTVIGYQSGSTGLSTSATSTSITTAKTLYAHYDFNGDGYTDLLYSNGTTWYVSFGSASGYGTPVSTGISATTTVLAGDLLGNGKDGILANNGGTWYYYTWNGSAFTSASTGLAYDSTAQQYVLADVNGDGLPDLVKLKWTSNTLSIYADLNTGGGSSPSLGAALLAYSASPGNFGAACTITQAQIAANSDQTSTLGTLRYFDFNGDGRQDIALQLNVTHSNMGAQCTPPFINDPLTYELISNSTSSSAAFSATLVAGDYTTLAFVNWNSDGCTDLYTAGTIYIAGCNGSIPTTISVPGTVIGALDWNEDGWTDLLVQNGSTVGVYVSTGGGVGSLITTSIPYSSTTTYFTFDANGDGLDDLGYMTSSGTVGYYLHNGGGAPADLMTSVADGYGNSESPGYVSLVQNNYSENGYGTATYPDEVYIGPLYVVSNVTYSDPSSSSGGTYNQQLWYYGAWTNLQGRGWESFYATRTYDSRSGLYDYRYYERSFPSTGLQFQDILSNGTFYPTQWVGTPATTTLSSTQYEQRYFPYLSGITAYRKEVGGSENGDLITTTTTNYTYDNYGNATQVATTTTDNDPNSPYLNDTWTKTVTNTADVDTTHWCLGLFTETQVAYTTTLSGSNSVTRTQTFTPDTTNCRYTQIVSEPNSSQFKVTQALGYDSFGNLNSDTVTGVGMTARQTTANWGTTGQFPMSMTDATNATKQFNYNFSYGLKSSVTDPNNLTTSWQYGDGFGRVTKETRPDGTYTSWSYLDMHNYGYSYHGLLSNYDIYSSNGTLLSDHDTGHDPIDRAVVQVDENLGGGYNQNNTSYDSLGRVASRSFPCAFVSWPTTCTYSTTNSYDVLNRLTQSQRPISSTNSNLQTTTYAYAGRTTTVTDPQSNAQVEVMDVNGWLRQAKDPMGYTVTLAYDAAGSKTKLTDSLGNTLWSGTYNYGLDAYLVTATDIDMGAWSFTVDALGESTGWTDAKNQSFSETYDALSRPLTRTEPDLFTQWTWGSSSSSHNVGKLQSACTGTGSSCTSSGYSESDTYDSVGRLSQRTITLSGYSPFTYTWAYNSTTGLLNTLTYPTSTSSYALELQYGYTHGILQSVTDISDTPNVTVWAANAMDAAGHVNQETLGNGIVTSRSFDPVTQWLGTAQSGVGGGAGVKNLAFLYDEMGNVTQRQDNNLGLTENIYYDNDYRLSYSKLNGTQNLSVNYDGTGNIISRSDVAGGASWTYDPNHKHEVTQAGSSAYQYSYDANGNAITRQGSTISWSSYNYPTTINAGSGGTAETVAFSYGPDRQRWQQMYTGNGSQETTNYVGGLLEVVASGGLTDYRHYVSIGNEHVAVYSRKSNGTNTFSYLLSDHQASVASITNASGAQVVGESFTAFGSRRNPATWSGAPSNSDLTTIAGITRQGYTFQTALGLWMGMNHMNGRVEDAVTGRMLSGDIRIPDAMNPQSYNRYSYANNNPVTLMDPSGFDSNDPMDSDCDGLDAAECENEGPDPNDPQKTDPRFNGVPPTTPAGCSAMGCYVVIPDGICWESGCEPTVQWIPNTDYVPPGTMSFVPSVTDSGDSPNAGGDPCSSGSKIVDWLYKNVSIEAGAGAGSPNVGGATGSVDMNLREVSVDAGAAAGTYFGAEGHIDVNFQVIGPGVSDGLYRSYTVCGGAGVGGCVNIDFQHGDMSVSIAPGLNAGFVAGAAFKYHKTLLPPAPFPGTPTSCGKD